MQLRFKRLALAVAVASSMLVTGAQAADSNAAITSTEGHSLRAGNQPQYQNIDFDARYNDGVLFENESNLFWGAGDRIKVQSRTGKTLAHTNPLKMYTQR